MFSVMMITSKSRCYSLPIFAMFRVQLTADAPHPEFEDVDKLDNVSAATANSHHSSQPTSGTLSSASTAQPFPKAISIVNPRSRRVYNVRASNDFTLVLAKEGKLVNIRINPHVDLREGDKHIAHAPKIYNPSFTLEEFSWKEVPPIDFKKLPAVYARLSKIRLTG